jgi:hypothetical protein
MAQAARGGLDIEYHIGDYTQMDPSMKAGG